MNAGAEGVPQDYGSGYDYWFVVGGDGIILWRGSWNDSAIRAAVQQGLDDMAMAPAPEAPRARHELKAGYPNPFNPTTRIPYQLGDSAGDVAVRLEIMDLRGRVVSTLVDSRQSGGREYEVTWNGTDIRGRVLPSGTYMARLTVDGQSQGQLLTLVK